MITAIPRPAGSAVVAAQLPFEQLYADHAASVHRFCLSQVGGAAVAEDLTHDTFVRAYAAYGRTTLEAGAERSWLVAIARNVAADHHRRSGRWRRLLDRQKREHAADPGSVESVAEERSRLREVVVAMAALGRRDRELIGLRVAADLPYREVGRLLGISEPAAKVATHRALQRLRARLQPATPTDYEETSP